MAQFMTGLTAFFRQLEQRLAKCTQELHLEINGQALSVYCNNGALVKYLRHYFRHCLAEEPDEAIDVFVIDCKCIELDVEWQDWKREQGKSGRKDAYYDFEDIRLIHKVRTGMLFVQSEDICAAFGPCLDNKNQIINFINNQYMNKLQQDGWLICHAAALCHGEHGLAIAGFSGGGKSTSMLKMLDNDENAFCSNDRLFLKAEADRILMRGIPKLPRINPGTLLHNPRLSGLLDPDKRSSYAALDPEQLWDLEEKYDVDIAEMYGANRIQHQATLAHYIILNWQPQSSEACRIEVSNAQEHPQLLDAIMKSSGPFYQHSDGSFNPNQQAPCRDDYVQLLGSVPMSICSGGVDFDALMQHAAEHLVPS